LNLWLDDVRDPARHGALGFHWVKTVAAAKAAMLTGTVDRASLDHDLSLCDACWEAAKAATQIKGVVPLVDNYGLASYSSCEHNGTGYQFVCWMEETGNWPKQKPTVHSANPVGAARMRQAIDRHFGR
jgi:hypothetical protein